MRPDRLVDRGGRGGGRAGGRPTLKFTGSVFLVTESRIMAVVVFLLMYVCAHQLPARVT